MLLIEISNILQRLFDKSSLEEIPLTTLEELTRKHPYFAAGHFFLSGKLAGDNPERFREQLQKTNLYFHDTLWLHHLIKQYQPGLSPATGVPPADAAAQPEVLPEADYMDSAPPADIAPAPELPVEPIAPAGPEDGLTELPVADTPVAGATDEAIPEAAAPGQESSSGAVSEQLPEERSSEGDKTEQDKITLPAEDPKEEIPALSFDPYHTIDYFASLGIRVSQEIKPDDKLGNQLKSFTQWLKTMKRFPTGDPANPGSLQDVIQPYETARIEKIAAHSIEGKEVVTEAMAEVLIKQGKLEKARGVYRKLSLLNPDKNAYFAAKIEELKQY